MTDVNGLDEQECGYMRTENFDKDDILARLGLGLGTELQVDGSSPTYGPKLPPHLSEPSISDPSFPLFDAAVQPSIEFDDMADLAAVNAPLPTSTGWGQPTPRTNNVTEVSFIYPKVVSWLTWSEISANKGLNGQGNPTTELNTHSPEILVTPLSTQLHLGPQGYNINSSLTPLQLPQCVRPGAQTAPAAFRGTKPNAPLSGPPGSPVSIMGKRPHRGVAIGQRILGSSSINDSPATSDASGSTIHRFAATETDATSWYDLPGSGSCGGSGPSNFLQPPDHWVRVSPLRRANQPPTRSTLGKIIMSM